MSMTNQTIQALKTTTDSIIVEIKEYMVRLHAALRPLNHDVVLWRAWPKNMMQYLTLNLAKVIFKHY